MCHMPSDHDNESCAYNQIKEPTSTSGIKEIVSTFVPPALSDRHCICARSFGD